MAFFSKKTAVAIGRFPSIVRGQSYQVVIAESLIEVVVYAADQSLVWDSPSLYPSNYLERHRNEIYTEIRNSLGLLKQQHYSIGNTLSSAGWDFKQYIQLGRKLNGARQPCSYIKLQVEFWDYGKTKRYIFDIVDYDFIDRYVHGIIGKYIAVARELEKNRKIESQLLARELREREQLEIQERVKREQAEYNRSWEIYKQQQGLN